MKSENSSLRGIRLGLIVFIGIFLELGVKHELELKLSDGANKQTLIVACLIGVSVIYALVISLLHIAARKVRARYENIIKIRDAKNRKGHAKFRKEDSFVWIRLIRGIRG